MIDHGSPLWAFLSSKERILADDGAFLIQDSTNHPDEEPTDYSYLVFPFAKLYEGFLKDVFYELSIIDRRDYISSHFRIGKVLSPNLIRRLGKHSAYLTIRNRFSDELALEVWRTWKEGRNLVFHYFPDSVSFLSRDRALTVITTLIQTMEHLISQTGARRSSLTRE